MKPLTIDKDELYSFIKQAVREVFQEELFRLRLENLPAVSKEEMEDIERLYGRPRSERDIASSESFEI